MKALFAMDLMAGKTVRLMKGDFARVTEYSVDPVSKIKEMVGRGARDFHIIDLDGARTGKPLHRELIREIRSEVKGYMEVGGGVRSHEDLRSYDEIGADGIIIGTRALEDDQFFRSLSGFRKVILGLDTLEGRPMVRGWKTAVGREIDEILEVSREVGVMALLCTSISQDGMLAGPDYEGLKKILDKTDIPVIASGGVTSIDDVKRLKEMGAWAAILGKAVYEGLIQIEEAVQYAD